MCKSGMLQYLEETAIIKSHANMLIWKCTLVMSDEISAKDNTAMGSLSSDWRIACGHVYAVIGYI